MNILSWLILIVIAGLGTIGQLSLKYVFHPVNYSGDGHISRRNILYSRYFWIWFICYVIVTILWLFVLQTIPLSQAYPALGLTFALVPIASHRFLHEEVVFSQWLGIAIIVAGVVIVAQK